MDIFKKCYDYTIVRDAKEAGIYPYFHALESRQDVEVVMEGKRRIMLGSNNYLGLTTNPEIIAAAHKALDEYGTGCSGSNKPRNTQEQFKLICQCKCPYALSINERKVEDDEKQHCCGKHDEPRNGELLKRRTHHAGYLTGLRTAARERREAFPGNPDEDRCSDNG